MLEFQRCAPEEVGIPSQAVLDLVEQLEADDTDIHSLMVLRHDKVAAEGWWAPYAPGLRHMMMSASKTFAGTAVGIACREGVTSLDERLADIFPEYLPAEPGANLLAVTVADLLCMGSGSDHEVPVDKDWPRSYFQDTEFAHEPGTEFLYNNAPATLLALIIKKRTGLDLPEYLHERLFDKLGIDYANVTWFKAPDGTTFAPGGLHCTTEDLLRLMRLYLRGGVWEGERILDEGYVRLATSKRIDSSNIFGYAETDRFSDNVFGYGYMMWMSHGDMGYRAEGACGQFGIVMPALDMIIAITQSHAESPVAQTTLDHVWEFVEKLSDEPLPADEAAATKLTNRLSRLAVPRDPVNPHGHFPGQGRTYRCEGHGVAPYVLFYDPIRASYEADEMTGLTEFSFRQAGPRLVTLSATINGRAYELAVPIDGTRQSAELPEMVYASQVMLSGWWRDERTFAVRFRWYETFFTKDLVFRFADAGCVVDEEMLHGEDPDLRTGVAYAQGRGSFCGSSSVRHGRAKAPASLDSLGMRGHLRRGACRLRWYAIEPA